MALAYHKPIFGHSKLILATEVTDDLLIIENRLKNHKMSEIISRTYKKTFEVVWFSCELVNEHNKLPAEVIKLEVRFEFNFVLI